jgi:cytochrome bd-type quinol oxidase subunit 1
MKLAAIEAMWETEKPPASFTVFGFPDVEQRKTHLAIHVPYAMGIIATRSLDKPLPGINDLEAAAQKHVRRGLVAYEAMVNLQKDPKDAAARQVLDHNVDALGYALLLKRWMDDPLKATDADIKRAATKHDPQRPGAVLVVPVHGGLGLLLHRAVRARVLVRVAARARPPRVVPAPRAVEPPAAVGRGGARLDRRGVRTPALGDRRRAADRARRVVRVGRAGLRPASSASSCSTPRCWSSTSS